MAAHADDQISLEQWETTAIRLTAEQERQISLLRLVPASRCCPGDRFQLHANVGGQYILCTVRACTAPYQADYGRGRTATYADVHGFNIGRKSVLLNKLLVPASIWTAPEHHTDS